MSQFLYKTIEEDGNGDYTTLEACLNANEQNLTGHGWFDIAICGTDLGGGGWDSPDTTNVVLHNYTTTSADYINIYTTESARHNGVVAAISGLKTYRLSGRSVSITCHNVTLNGLEIGNLTGAYARLIYSKGNNNTFKNNIIHSLDLSRLTSFHTGLYLDLVGGETVYVYNNIIYDIRGLYYNTSDAIYFPYHLGTSNVRLFNNTIADIDRYGIWADDDNGTNLYMINNILQGGGTNLYIGANIVKSDVRNNIVQSSIANGLIGATWATGAADNDALNHLIDSDANFGSVQIGSIVRNTTDGLTGYVTAVTPADITLNADIFPDGNENYIIYKNMYGAVLFVNEAGNNWHISPADTVAIDKAVNLSAYFTDDIDGETRPTGSLPWDCGADEYVPPANNYPVNLLKKGFISGYHCFMSNYISAKIVELTPLKLPDGSVF